MNVYAGIDETAATPWQEYADNTYQANAYDINAKLLQNEQQIVLMDLGGKGFLADGKAKPITNADINGKYGYLSELCTDENGFLETALDVTVITTSQTYDVLTFTLADSDGNQWTEYVDGLTWEEVGENRYSTTASFSEGNPLRTLIVLEVKLGKSWSFDNASLISCTLNLRGVETTSDNPELQLSEIEIKAYEPEDYSETIGHITKGAPIWYQAGYPGDMSPIRKFYLNQKIEYEKNVLTIKGYDASYLLEGQNDGEVKLSTNNEILQDYENSILGIITNANIEVQVGDLAEIGTTTSTASNYFLDNKSRRNLVANAMNMYREEGFCINYVDAGIPRFTGKDPISTTWDIYADQVADFKTEIELATREIQSTLYTTTIGSANEDLTTVEVVSGQQYWINLAEPVYSITATLGTISLYNPYTALLTATSTGTSTIRGRKIILSSASANNPYVATETEAGETIVLEDQSLLASYMGNMAQLGIDAMLNRSNIMYTFTYRGNPKMQPRDLINFYRMDGTETAEVMTIESISLRHENGGLVSEVVARKGVV